MYLKAAVLGCGVGESASEEAKQLIHNGIQVFATMRNINFIEIDDDDDATSSVPQQAEQTQQPQQFSAFTSKHRTDNQLNTSVKLRSPLFTQVSFFHRVQCFVFKNVINTERFLSS